MDSDEKPDELNPDEKPREKKTNEEQGGREKHRHRVRKRIKIRKRVRIKRKTSPKKKARKMLETFAWVLVVAAFLVTLVILILQLDFDSKHRQKRRTVSEARTAAKLLPELNHDKSSSSAWRL